MHKFITISSGNKAVLPYLKTTVAFEKSFAEIQALLMKFGCSDLMTRQVPAMIPNSKLPCTKYTIAFVNKGNKFLIEFPILVAQVGRDHREKKVMMNASGRIVLNKIKALLVDVEMEVYAFEQAMMPYQLIASADGQTTTIQDYVADNQEKIRMGVPPGFLLGP